jgi:hypothetical protein
MNRLTRKFIAVLMLMWLPIATGSALAASISMQMPRAADCHETAEMQAMSHDGMTGHHMHHHEMPAPAEKQDASCDTCGVCHLACAGYLAVPAAATVAVQTAAREATPYVVFFQSVTSVPLLPPPLVRT